MLNRDFTDLIDMSDATSRRPQDLEQARLSRALACLALRGLTDLKDEELVGCLVDGQKDEGIDAIAVSETTREIWLVQSKWSEKGTAGFDKAAALKFLRGWKLIDNNSFDQLNSRIQRMQERLRAALRDPHVHVHLVVALTGPGDLSDEVREVFDDEAKEANGYGLTFDYQVLNTARLWQQIRAEEAPEDVEIQARMQQWMHVHTPVEMYQGIVPAYQVAEWYGTAGDQLFRRNIRSALGPNDVNTGIVETLRESPDYFLLYHNGITVICDSLKLHFPERRRKEDPVVLTMRGASVVNGAQSVTSLHHAATEDSECVQDAKVSVHVICTEGVDDDSLPDTITRTRNRQNQVLERDFVALDRTQTLIREDFALRIGKTYTFKRGEVDPAPEQGCSVVQAAVALACAHPNTKLTVRAKQNVDTLWERGPDGAYDLLFREQPGAHQIWGSVRLHRQVLSRAHEVAKDYRGRASELAERGDFLLSHMAFQMTGRRGLDDEEYDWDGEISRVPERVGTALPWLVHHVDQLYGGSRSSFTRTLADPQRCRAIVHEALADIRAGKSVPEIPREYRKRFQQGTVRSRRPNTVTILKNAGVLTEGTELRFRPRHSTEQQALRDWLAEDPGRARATWTSNRRYPLLWSADSRRYSPSGLVMYMYELAGWENSPVAVQGPSRWYIDGTAMSDLAEKIFTELGETEETDWMEG